MADPNRPNTPREQEELKRMLDSSLTGTHVEGCGALAPHPNRSGWKGQCTCGLDAARSAALYPGVDRG